MNHKEDYDINLIDLGKKLWCNIFFIARCSIVGMIIGLVIAFSIPPQYTTSVLFTTTSNRTTNGGMSALASLAGVNLSASQDDLFPPKLYSDVIYSTPFVKDLLNINVQDKDLGINTTLYSYLSEEQKSPWWNIILRIPSTIFNHFNRKSTISKDADADSNPYFITIEDMAVMDKLTSSYNIELDKTTDVITLIVTSQSPKISAQLAHMITSKLQTYIIEQRTKKAKIDLENTERLFITSKEEYHEKQKDLASFVDKNKNISSAEYRTKQENLQNEVQLSYSIYTQMAQQVQISKIKVQDDTPVFVIIEPALEPISASHPKKKIILGGMLFLAIITSSFWILKKDLWLFLTSND